MLKPINFYYNTFVTEFWKTDHNVTIGIQEILILSIEATMVLSC